MKLSEVLYGAADHIQVFGHNKGNGFANPNTIYSAACTHGGLSAAMHLYHGVDSEALREAAKAAVRRQIGTDLITVWNDSPERTAEQVIATLRAAAVIEAAKENADVRESVSA